MNEEVYSQIKIDKLLRKKNSSTTNSFENHLAKIIQMILFNESEDKENRLRKLSNLNNESIKNIRLKLANEMKSQEIIIHKKNHYSDKTNEKINERLGSSPFL